MVGGIKGTHTGGVTRGHGVGLGGDMETWGVTWGDMGRGDTHHIPVGGGAVVGQQEVRCGVSQGRPVGGREQRGFI